MIATAELGQFVSLERLVYVLGFLYDTAIYKCAYLRDNRTRAKISIFSTGKMICERSSEGDPLDKIDLSTLPPETASVLRELQETRKRLAGTEETGRSESP